MERFAALSFQNHLISIHIEIPFSPADAFFKKRKIQIISLQNAAKTCIFAPHRAAPENAPVLREKIGFRSQNRRFASKTRVRRAPHRPRSQRLSASKQDRKIPGNHLKRQQPGTIGALFNRRNRQRIDRNGRFLRGRRSYFVPKIVRHPFDLQKCDHQSEIPFFPQTLFLKNRKIQDISPQNAAKPCVFVPHRAAPENAPVLREKIGFRIKNHGFASEMRIPSPRAANAYPPPNRIKKFPAAT